MVVLSNEIESAYMAMNTFHAQRSLTLGQIELYVLFVFAVAGAIAKTLEALTHTRGNHR
jgi:hypothetical protein